MARTSQPPAPTPEDSIPTEHDTTHVATHHTTPGIPPIPKLLILPGMRLRSMQISVDRGIQEGARFFYKTGSIVVSSDVDLGSDTQALAPLLGGQLLEVSEITAKAEKGVPFFLSPG